ncbi:unnamed protein product, partial [Ectocarpus sp. 12 AP-2014]
VIVEFGTCEEEPGFRSCLVLRYAVASTAVGVSREPDMNHVVLPAGPPVVTCFLLGVACGCIRRVFFDRLTTPFYAHRGMLCVSARSHWKAEADALLSPRVLAVVGKNIINIARDTMLLSLFRLLKG